MVTKSLHCSAMRHDITTLVIKREMCVVESRASETEQYKLGMLV